MVTLGWLVVDWVFGQGFVVVCCDSLSQQVCGTTLVMCLWCGDVCRSPPAQSLRQRMVALTAFDKCV